MNWFEEAIEFEIYMSSDVLKVKELTDSLFKEVSKKIPIRNKARSKETLKLVLLNLWVALHCGVPVYYSRNPNNYLPSRRYGLLHVKYNRLIPIVDALEDMGLIQQKIGWFDREKNIKRQTRMYATDDLIKMLFDLSSNRYDIIEKLSPREMIQLKDDDKRLIDYQETPNTVNMRRNLHHYNSFIRQQNITIKLHGDCPMNVRFLQDLNRSLLKGVINIDNIELPYNNLIINNIIDNTTLAYSNNNILIYTNLHYPYLNYLSDILHTNINIDNSIFYNYISTMTNKIREMDSEVELLDEQMLRGFGISKLECHMRYEALHRVFNNGSFDEGGRFFGGYHLRIPSHVRSYISINGKSCVELDYSSHHIRMLYHMEGVDYRDDPYSAASGNEEQRNIHKLMQLIAINAANEKEAIMAIRNQFRKKGIVYDLTNKSLGGCLEKFRSVHKPIAKYLNSGIGLTLQNKDSQITERIILSLMRDGIACLPVHDSYIVEETYGDMLMEKMTDEYEKTMNFKPVIG